MTEWVSYLLYLSVLHRWTPTGWPGVPESPFSPGSPDLPVKPSGPWWNRDKLKNNKRNAWIIQKNKYAKLNTKTIHKEWTKLWGWKLLYYYYWVFGRHIYTRVLIQYIYIYKCLPWFLFLPALQSDLVLPAINKCVDT